MSDTPELETIPTPSAIDLAKQRADMMGIKYHPSISLTKLQEKIAAHQEGKADPDEQETNAPVKSVAPAGETKDQERRRLYDEARKLIHVDIICRNPAKREWDGEIFTAGNGTVGTFKKFIPFNTSGGTLVPQIILNLMKDRKFQYFYTERNKKGVEVRKGRTEPEFGITYLPQLTQEELDKLAKVQAATGATRYD